MGRAGFFARIYQLDVGGETQRVLARDVQLHPVTDRPLHVDFLRVGPPPASASSCRCSSSARTARRA